MGWAMLIFLFWIYVVVIVGFMLCCEWRCDPLVKILLGKRWLGRIEENSHGGIGGRTVPF